MDMAINLAEERRNHKVLAGLEHHIIQDELRGGLLNTLDNGDEENNEKDDVEEDEPLINPRREIWDLSSKKPTARFELGKDFGTSDRKTNLTKLLFIKVKGGTCQHQLWGLEQLGTETTTEAKNDQTTQQHSGRTETGRPVNGIV
ncbi:hypothetical protein BGX31_007717 [Mortierella sp. GBA43]|nr:hypothetical protein BGX31_007717 [Mortierella sp. GBA43]